MICNTQAIIPQNKSKNKLKYDLFRSNIITDSRCVCGFTREDASHFLLNCRLYIEQRTVLFHFLHHHDFQRDIRILLFGDSNKTQAQNILLSKAVQTFISQILPLLLLLGKPLRMICNRWPHICSICYSQSTVFWPYYMLYQRILNKGNTMGAIIWVDVTYPTGALCPRVLVGFILLNL